MTPTLIEQYSTHQRVLGYSRRTISQRAWSVGLWFRFLDVHGVTVHTAGVAELVEFLDRWPAPSPAIRCVPISASSTGGPAHVTCSTMTRPTGCPR